ncbi:hypothetical protein CBR_g10857 [Chara braunii]|uniref:Protein YIP n=1 Tax=Chara braunii TaxID=69332 RepID=A0A388KPE3_CHABU|nr:hypothetical protein CBR_g10857 [Chara braunii]|eukprot:GBG71921.1 hypothetical protein CBR_g10857 [Chara braunii]
MHTTTTTSTSSLSSGSRLRIIGGAHGGQTPSYAPFSAKGGHKWGQGSMMRPSGTVGGAPTQPPFMPVYQDDANPTWFPSSSSTIRSAGHPPHHESMMGTPYGVGVGGGMYGGGGGGGGAGGGVGGSYGYFEDEPPLLDELGINVPQIGKKLKVVMLPFGPLDLNLMADGDLSGPVFIGFLLGLCELLAGKLHFGVILGWATVVSIAMYTVFNLLVNKEGGTLDLYVCASVIGYCLCPVVVLSSLCLLIPKGGVVAFLLGVMTVLWSSHLCSNLLVGLVPQASPYSYLVAYPCLLIYSAFTMLVLF